MGTTRLPGQSDSPVLNIILFCYILFCSVLFYSILFYSILFYSILSYPILFYSILFYSILFYDSSSPSQTYETWNGDDYDTQMLAVGYKAPLWAVDYLVHLKLDENVRILDVCCGTGLVARYLREKGYTNVDALDSSEVID